jgi:hypothetical protein
MIEAEAGCGRGAGSWWGNNVLAWRVRSRGLVWVGRWGGHNNDLGFAGLGAVVDGEYESEIECDVDN